MLEPGFWRLEEARYYASGAPPQDRDTVRIKTNLTPAQVARKLRDARDRAVLAAVLVYRARRECRPGRRRLSPAVLPAPGAAVLSRRHGAAGRRGQPALLPLRRRAEDGAGRHRGGLLALRAGEGHRRPEQGRADAAACWRRRCRRSSAGSPASSRCSTRRTGDDAAGLPSSALLSRRRSSCGAAVILAMAAIAFGAWPTRGRRTPSSA